MIGSWLSGRAGNLFVPERDGGLDVHRSASGDVACGQCDETQQHRHSYVGLRVSRADADEKFADEVSCCNWCEKTDRQAGSDDGETMAGNHPEDGSLLCA